MLYDPQYSRQHRDATLHGDRQTDRVLRPRPGCEGGGFVSGQETFQRPGGGAGHGDQDPASLSKAQAALPRAACSTPKKVEESDGKPAKQSGIGRAARPVSITKADK